MSSVDKLELEVMEEEGDGVDAEAAGRAAMVRVVGGGDATFVAANVLKSP